MYQKEVWNLFLSATNKQFVDNVSASWFELERNQEGSMVRYNVQEITFVNCNSATDKQRYIFLTFVATWLAR